MTHTGTGTHSADANAARPLRMILAGSDTSAAGCDAFDAVLAEFDNCPSCRRSVMARLAVFGAQGLRGSPERERRVIDRLGQLLDTVASQ